MQIGPLAPEDRARGLQLLFGHLEPERRAHEQRLLLASIARGHVPPDRLLEARREGRLVGVVCSQIQPGRAAVVWLPRLADDEPATTAAELLTATCKRLAEHGVCVAQVLVERAGEADVTLLGQAGFEHLTDLLYLVCLEGELPDSPPETPFTFEPYCPANHQRLTQVIEATYQQTLDCPRLNGVRRIEDVLAGYRATGEFDPGRWLIVRCADRDVGCLLLTDHPKQGNWELIYMGIAADHRGQGWGMEITRYAQWLTRRAGQRRLVLAVDAENEPAIRIYARAGFRAWDRRSVYLRAFDAAGA